MAKLAKVRRAVERMETDSPQIGPISDVVHIRSGHEYVTFALES